MTRIANTLPMTSAVLALAALCGSAHALDVPSTHPRLWYGDSTRLAQARSYYTTHPFTPPGYPLSARARDQALIALMTNTATGCSDAIAWLMRFDMETSDQDGDGIADPGICDLNAEGHYCDRARWFGEDAMLVYDWCHASLTPTQRDALVTKWNRYVGLLNQGPYNWQNMPANNYYWGFLRNSLLWGIASYDENPRAQEFIDHALTARFQQTFVPWASTYGRGGIPGEGTQYGAYPIGYSALAFRTALDFGFDAYGQAPFFDQTPYYLTYATSPAPTNAPGHAAAYELFPFNDDHDFRLGASAVNAAYADQLGTLILRAPGSARAMHARAWIDKTQTVPSWWVRAALASAPGPSSADTLPLDYYAAGYKFLYSRSSRLPAATSIVMELGALGAATRGGTEHDGYEAGSFQIWRNGEWISRETTGYRGSDYLRGLNNGPAVTSSESIAHNAVLFEGKGQIHSFFAQPNVLRLQSAPRFTFAAVDLRPGYRLDQGPVPQSTCWLASEDWPYADAAVREFIVIREWNAVVVLDRLRSSADSQLPVYAAPCVAVDYTPKTAEAVRKTYVFHYSNAPAVVGNRVSAPIGTQQVDNHILLPASASPRVIDETSCANCSAGQYRLEVDATGSAISYFINVVQARDANQGPLSAVLTQTGSQWTIALQRSDGQRVTIKLEQGLTSSGGSVQFSDDNILRPLNPGVQGMTVTPDGPVWEGIGDTLFANGFES